MNNRQIFGILFVTAVLAVLVWVAIPAGAGIKSQMHTLFTVVGGGTVWFLGWALAIISWTVEAVLLFAGPVILGIISAKIIVPWLDERYTPDKDLSISQEVVLSTFFTILVSTLWLLVPIVVASLPPASSFILGPWIQKHVETGLVWWGVYAIVVYPVSYWLAKVDWSQVYY